MTSGTGRLNEEDTRGTVRDWRHWLPAVCGTLLLCLPLMVYHVSRSTAATRNIQSLPFVVMPPPGEPSGKEEELFRHLRLWSRLRDPALFLGTDSHLGFGHEFSLVFRTAWSPLPEFTIPLTAFQPQWQDYGMTKEVSSQKVATIYAGPRETAVSLALPPPPQRQAPKNVVLWQNEAGMIWNNPPAISLEEVRKVAKMENQGTHTSLEILGEGAFPRICVRKTCGNGGLDRLALEHLRTVLRAPNAPSVKGSLLLNVYWYF